MGQKSEIYANYCKKFKSDIKCEVINGNQEVFALLKEAKKERFSGICKVCGSGEFDGVYKHKDGRIFQVNIAFGWIYKAFVFKSESEWNEYEEPMPSIIYWAN